MIKMAAKINFFVVKSQKKKFKSSIAGGRLVHLCCGGIAVPRGETTRSLELYNV
jgi:hypothetical protein